MQKGRFSRAAPPYTYSADNWGGNPRSFLAARLWGDFHYSFGLGVQDSPTQQSTFCGRPFGLLSFQYKWTWKIGIINFSGQLLFEPTFARPTWSVGLLLQSGGFGSLSATYESGIVAITPQALINQTMLTLTGMTVSGSFRAVAPQWRVFAVTYNEEP